MDEKQDIPQVINGREQGRYPAPIRCGNWEIEKTELGFIVRSLVSIEEYHFKDDSNGWVTVLNRMNNLMKVFNSSGDMQGLPQPVTMGTEESVIKQFQS